MSVKLIAQLISKVFEYLKQNPLLPGVLFYNKLMNKCNCTAGQVASPQRYNKATTCEDEGPCGLRTIVIPKTKGSDAEGQPYAPQLGSNRNAIVIYEATGAIYIYDNNGVFTNFTGSSITPVLDALTQQVETSTELVNTMEGKLTAEIANRISADELLQNTINSLEAALSTETASRSSDVQALQNALNDLKAQVNAMAGSDTEREERIAADENLQEQITALQTATENVVTTNDLKTINGQSIIGQGDIELDIPGLNIVQETGDSETEVMSQKAVTEALATAGAGITSAILTGSASDNQLTVTTSGPTPDSSSVGLKTINGQSLIGTGDITVTGGGGATGTADKIKVYGGSKAYTADDDRTITNTASRAFQVTGIPAGTYLTIIDGTMGMPSGSNGNAVYVSAYGPEAGTVETVVTGSSTGSLSKYNAIGYLNFVEASNFVSVTLYSMTSAGVTISTQSRVRVTLIPVEQSIWVTGSTTS